MQKMTYDDFPDFSQAMMAYADIQQVRDWVKNYALPYKELMIYYHCAMLEVETKFRVLNEDLGIQQNTNPIESIKARLKTPDSILEKLRRRDFPITVESMEENLNDIAGVRVVCSFQSDIYRLADAFLKQDDVTLLQKKDYIASPKANGYRSLHLLVSVPIFLHDEKRLMKVEVQLRTLAMDVWASLEHKLLYKQEIAKADEIRAQLNACAEMCANVDARMENIRQKTVQQ